MKCFHSSRSFDRKENNKLNVTEDVEIVLYFVANSFLSVPNANC